MTAAVTKSSTTGPRRLDDRVAEQQQQRQRDELDPARDDDRLGRARRRLATRAGRGRRSRRRDGAAADRREAGRRRAGARSSPRCARVCAVPDAPASILFIGDVVGGLGRRTLLALLPGLRRAPRADVRRGQRRERRGRPRHHAEDRRRAVRRRRRRHHAGQPRLPSQGDLPVPRRSGAHHAPGELSALAAGARLGDRRARRRAPRGGQPQRQPLPARRAAGLRRDRRRARPARGQGRPRPRRHARRGDEREGRRWAGSSTAA